MNISFRSVSIFLSVFLLSYLLNVSTANAQVDEQLVQVADEMYNFGDVKDALDIYKQALSVNESNVRANFMAGKCYLEGSDKPAALPYLKRAYELNPHVAPNILFLIATANHLGYEFDEAIRYYNLYRNALDTIPVDENFTETFRADEIKRISRRIEECNNGKEYKANPVKAKIENISLNVNSTWGDYAPVLSQDEKSIYFTSRREGSTGGNKDVDNEFFEDIYTARYNDTTQQWGTPANIGISINTDLHEATVALSPDGKQLFLYVDNDQYPGDIFYSYNKNNAWTKPQPFVAINTENNENSVCLSPNGKVLFFSSNRTGGQGGKDIWMIKKQKDGEWGTPVNLGNVVNTPYDDEGPFLDIDGKTLYFTSKGHKGMGGFDIYKSVYDSTAKVWSAPENMGYPINSTDDDVYFQMGAKSRKAYYASVKEGGAGELDIYRITLGVADSTYIQPKDSTPVVAKHDKKGVILRLRVVNENNELLDVKIEIRDRNDKLIFEGPVSKGFFVYPFNNQEGSPYIVTTSKQGYMFSNEVIKIPAVTDSTITIERTIVMKDFEVGEITILKNIYYDFDKATLKPESFTELNKVVVMMRENPSMRIEISSHTDAEGSHEYNMALSQRRAESVMRYLISKGIAKERLVPKGYGETRPIASNDDEEEGRELNRRTEIKILQK